LYVYILWHNKRNDNNTPTRIYSGHVTLPVMVQFLTLSVWKTPTVALEFLYSFYLTQGHCTFLMQKFVSANQHLYLPRPNFSLRPAPLPRIAT